MGFYHSFYYNEVGLASGGGMFTMSTHTFGDDPLLAKYPFDEFQYWDLAINYMDQCAQYCTIVFGKDQVSACARPKILRDTYNCYNL